MPSGLGSGVHPSGCARSSAEAGSRTTGVVVAVDVGVAVAVGVAVLVAVAVGVTVGVAVSVGVAVAVAVVVGVGVRVAVGVALSVGVGDTTRTSTLAPFLVHFTFPTQLTAPPAPIDVPSC